MPFSGGSTPNKNFPLYSGSDDTDWIDINQLMGLIDTALGIIENSIAGIDSDNSALVATVEAAVASATAASTAAQNALNAAQTAQNLANGALLRTGGIMNGTLQAAQTPLATKGVRNIFINTTGVFPAGSTSGDVLLVIEV